MSWKIYCLEGEWSSDLRNDSSVSDVLALLARNDGVKFIHRDVRTAADVEHYLKRWGDRQYQDFRIGYVALHGQSGSLGFRRTSVRISAIGEQVGRSCKGKIVFFGACSVAADGKEIRRFKQLTGAHAVCGYTRDAEWTPSAAFALLFLHALAHYKSLPRAERWLRKHAGGLCKHFGFATF